MLSDRNDGVPAGYASVDLLKLYIYGCPEPDRSSRGLEAETHRKMS